MVRSQHLWCLLYAIFKGHGGGGYLWCALSWGVRVKYVCSLLSYVGLQLLFVHIRRREKSHASAGNQAQIPQLFRPHILDIPVSDLHCITQPNLLRWAFFFFVKKTVKCSVILCDWKAKNSFFMSVHPSFLPQGTTQLPLDRFSWGHIEYLSKVCRQNSSFIKIWQNERHFTCRPIYIYYISLNFSYNEKCFRAKL